MRKEHVRVTSFLLVSFILNEVLAYSHDPVQYHIQTDTGPDRYFRFQTYDGQYRKEKRFEDGTVVGTYGWVDPNGLLRLYDYIADTQGYRIARTRIRKVKLAKEIGNEIPNTSEILTSKRQRPLPASGNIKKVLPIHDFKNLATTATTAVATPDATSTLPFSSVPILIDESSISSKPKLRPLFVNRRKAQNDKDKLRRRENYKSIRQQMKQQMEEIQQNFPNEAFRNNDEVTAKPIRVLTTRDKVFIPPAKYTSKSNPTFLPSESDTIPDIGYDNPGGRVSVDYDLGNQYRKEKVFSDGTVVGEHGYVDPLGILRITYYKSGGSEGQQEFKKNYWVGTRLPGQKDRYS